jgi:hypothetical protein
MSPKVTKSRFRVLATTVTFPIIFDLPARKKERKDSLTFPLLKQLHDRLLQMLEKRLGLFPDVFSRCLMIVGRSNHEISWVRKFFSIRFFFAGPLC